MDVNQGGKVIAFGNDKRRLAGHSMASEKVELARRIEEALAGRVGRPSKGKAVEEKIPQNFAEFKLGTESRDIAAKAVGMNRETYRAR